MSVDQNLRLYKVEQITNIADAIRTKLGSSDTYTVDEMCQVIQDIPVGTDLISMLVEADKPTTTLTVLPVTDAVLKTAATVIPSYLFYAKAVEPVNMANIVEVSNYAFYHANTIRNISLPECTKVGEQAFGGIPRFMSHGVSISFPKLQTIGTGAFQEARISGPINLPECLTIGTSGFRDCGSVSTSLYLPKCTSIGGSAFRGTTITYDVELPSIVSIGEYGFRETSSQNFTIGPNCTSIGNNLFSNAGVTNLIVQAITPPTLSGAFKSGNTGVQHIYVPAESVDAYKAANVWSNYASIIEAIPSA